MSLNEAGEYIPPKLGFEDLTSRLYDFVDNLDTNKRVVYGIIWFVIAAALMVAATLPLPDYLTFVSPVVGIPAGFILFVLGLSLIHSTNLQTWGLFQLKETLPPRKRVTPTMLGVAAVLALLIVCSSWIPVGVGGAIAVATALTAYNIIRRTPYEMELAMKGIPDPRDYIEEEEEYTEDYSEEYEAEPEETTGFEEGTQFKGRIG